MKKLSFQKFALNKIKVEQLNKITGGDTAGGSQWMTGGSLPNLTNIYISWSSDYVDGNGDTRKRDYSRTEFTGCNEQ